MGTNRSLVELIQRLALGHPFLDTATIAGKLWGEDKLESKRKKLCRKCNPDDAGAHFSPDELPRLLEILNEGLSPSERAEKGGDRVVHHLCRRLGLVAHRVAEPSSAGGGASQKKAAVTIKSLSKVINDLADAASGSEPLSSAITSAIFSQGYEALADLQELRTIFGPGKPC
jgi:hypothetical protein